MSPAGKAKWSLPAKCNRNYGKKAIVGVGKAMRIHGLGFGVRGLGFRVWG